MMKKAWNFKKTLVGLVVLLGVVGFFSGSVVLATEVINKDVIFAQNVTFEKAVLGIDNYPGKKFYVLKTSAALYNEAVKKLPPYPDGQRRLYVTVDEAINNCVASRGDVIYVLPGHTESYTAANGFDMDIAGVTLINIGEGSIAPSYTFADTDATVAVGAAGCKIIGGRYLAGISEVVIGISIEAGGDDLVLDGLFFPEPTTSSWEFDKAIVLASGADRVTIQNCTSYRCDAVGATDWLDITAGAVNGLKVLNNKLIGEYSNAPIYSDQADLETTIENNDVSNLTTGQFAIEFTAAATGMCAHNNLYTDGPTTALDPGSMKCIENYLTTAIDASAVLVPVPDDSTSNFIGVDDNNNVASTTNVADNADGSILERLEHVQSDTDKIDGATLAVSPTAGSLARFIASGGTALGTALADSKSLVDVMGTNGTTVTDAAASVLGAIGANNADNALNSSTVVYNKDGSVLERQEFLQDSVEICVEKSDGAVLNGSDDLFTVTGGPIVITRLVGVVTTIIGGAANCHIDGTTTTPAATTAMSTDVAIDNDAAGTTYTFTAVALPVLTPVTNGVQLNLANFDSLMPIGSITAHCSAAQSGVIKWYMTYKPLSPNSVVVAAP